MPKIADIEDTPNPNAKKFILKEPLSWGITRSYDNAGEAADDLLAASIFDIDVVVAAAHRLVKQGASFGILVPHLSALGCRPRGEDERLGAHP